MCRQLGHDKAIRFTFGSKFGAVLREYSFDDVTCLGNESLMEDCKFKDFDNCASNKGAGVVCADEYGNYLEIKFFFVSYN